MNYLSSFVILIFSNFFCLTASGQDLISTVVGNGAAGYSGDGGPGLAASLSNPGGVFVDTAGNIFIADYGNNVIRKVTLSTGLITTIAGSHTPGYTGDGGPATDAELQGPSSVFIDLLGNIYISDAFNNVIRKITASTGIINTVAGNGSSGYSGDGNNATSAELDVPTFVFVDAHHNLYISEFGNNVIRKVDNSTGKITTVAGNGLPGYSGDGNPSTNAELNGPNCVYVDSLGNIFIADTYNERIRKVTATTGLIGTVAGVGTSGYTGDGSSALAAQLNNPSGVWVDANSNIYIADLTNVVVRKVIAATGIIVTVAGDGVAGYTGDGGSPIDAELAGPRAVCMDKTGNLFISDGFNNVVRECTYDNLAVNGINRNPGIYTFPNPFFDYVTVTNLKAGDNLCLFDLIGKRISDIVPTVSNAEDQNFYFGNVPPAVYILSIFGSDGQKKASFVISKK